MNQFSRPTTEDEEHFGRIEERPQLEDRFRGLLTVSWTKGYLPRHLPISGIGPRTPMDVHSWASSDSRCIDEEVSTRLGDQDKDSSPLAYSSRTLVILGLWYII